ncbi:MAG: hypothetical protein QXD02_05105 [Candidatus Parvarchaeum sp.]|nr:hypothetical protein [Candidatus Parvarchaeum tengchongense]MCW1299668.1 hypothetical protein [Candidatus Parvarchaeum tengchongense]
MLFKPSSKYLEHSSKLSSLSKTRRSQSALEYMMTYGWAILIIVIVAVILYSMGIFNPSSSVTTTSSGFSPFTISSTICNPAGLYVAIIGGGLPDTATSATISKIYVTSNTGTTALTKEYNLTPIIIYPGKTATILIPTVACNSAGIKYSLSAKLQYSYSTPAGSIITNSTGTIAGTSSSQPIVKYLPLTITSSTTTPSPFQQMAVINMDNYKSYAASNLSNIEFTYPNGTIIPSWRENGTNNTQTVVYWLRLGSFTTATVEMDFFSTSTNVLNSVNTGEAPQLTCSNPSDTAQCSTYGEYDNGNVVFNYYQNFKGNSYPTGWTTNYSDTAKYVQVHNGFTIDYSPNGVGVEFYYNKENFSLPNVLDWNGNYISNPARYCGWTILGWYNITPKYGSSAGWAQWQNSPTSWKYYQYGNVSQAAQDFYNSTALIGGTDVFSLINTGTKMSYLLNYTSELNVNPESIPLKAILFRNGGGCGPVSGSEVNVTWLDTRTYPPNGNMPSVTIGSLS